MKTINKTNTRILKPKKERSPGQVYFSKFISSFVKIDPVAEYKFDPTRKWSIDFAWPVQKVAVEIDGGHWMARGRHGYGKGFELDLEKRRAMIRQNWRPFHFTTKEVLDGYAFVFMQEYFKEIIL